MCYLIEMHKCEHSALRRVLAKLKGERNRSDGVPGHHTAPRTRPEMGGVFLTQITEAGAQGGADSIQGCSQFHLPKSRIFRNSLLVWLTVLPLRK